MQGISSRVLFFLLFAVPLVSIHVQADWKPITNSKGVFRLSDLTKCKVRIKLSTTDRLADTTLAPTITYFDVDTVGQYFSQNKIFHYLKTDLQPAYITTRFADDLAPGDSRLLYENHIPQSYLSVFLQEGEVPKISLFFEAYTGSYPTARRIIRPAIEKFQVESDCPTR